MPADADPGSFRDPLSRLYLDSSHAWRGLSPQGLADFEAFAATSTYREALDDGRLIATTQVAPGDSPLPDGWAGALRHERLRLISYPYEWTFAMLRDAALLQLDLGQAAISEGILVKDATPYNVQFVGSQPVFIDVGSFEPVRAGEPWPGYRQFCEQFLNPLYLQALADVPFQPWLRGSLRGISPAEAAAVLKKRKRWRRDLFTHVRLHARADARYSDAMKERDVGAELKAAGFGPALLRAQMANLQRAVQRLEWAPSASTWSSYGERAHYSDADLEAKAAFVASTTAALRPPLVLDLGANDGHFTRVAVDNGAEAGVAVDGDHLVVDHLYRSLRADGDQRILPLVMDLADPSPATGWRGVERASFVARVRPDLVLCLAVVHHLALTNTVPLDEVVEMLHEHGAPLVVEFPHREDPMVRGLLRRKRDGLFDHYDLPQWEKALGARFTVLDRQTLPSGNRTIYRCQPA